MSDEKQVFERFQKDVEKHVLTVLQDNGVYRHLRISAPGTSHMHYDITTWPGHLAYTGDMGTYVFARLDDMFEFFWNESKKINCSYWHEKCIAEGRSPAKEFSLQKFRAEVTRWMEECLADVEDLEEKQLIRADVQDQLLGRDFQFEIDARDAVSSFDFNGFTFNDFWEVNLEEFSYRFIWCLYAIVHGIDLYHQHNQQFIAALEGAK